MGQKIGIYFRYEIRPSGDTVTERIESFAFDGKGYQKAHTKKAPEGKIYTLKCLCGSNNWNDNGRFINEYICGCCGNFIQVVFTNHGLSGQGT